MSKSLGKPGIGAAPAPVPTPLMKESAKYDFMLLPPTVEDELWRAIIYKQDQREKGKVFRFVMNRYSSQVSHFEHLTEAQCDDFSKSARKLTTEESLAIFECLEVVLQIHPGIYRSRDYR